MEQKKKAVKVVKGRAMTEEEWLKCEDLAPMFDLLPADGSDRKLRLFCVGCCRNVEENLWAGMASHSAIETAEQYADQLTTDNAILSAQQSVESSLELYPGEPVYDASFWACGTPIKDSVWRCAFYAANSSTRPFDDKGSDTAAAFRVGVVRLQAAILRDIFGNPFRPVTLNHSWLTPTVLALANGIYDKKAFEHMPILADALQDAGCNNEDILNHCREPGEHVRGCWALDLLLGKS